MKTNLTVQQHKHYTFKVGDKVLRLFPSLLLFNTYLKLCPTLYPFLSQTMSDDSPIYYSYVHHIIIPSISCSSLPLADVASHSHLTFWPHYAYLLSPLSCTMLRLVMAGPSQAILVFNLSYIWRLSLRLDLLYQYQAIASEVPHDWYNDRFLHLWTIDPQADCLTSSNPTPSREAPWLCPLRDTTGRVDQYMTYPHAISFTDKDLTSTMPRAWA